MLISALFQGDFTDMRKNYIDELRKSCPFLHWSLGLPPTDEMDLSGRFHTLLIIDDLSDALLNSKKYCDGI